MTPMQDDFSEESILTVDLGIEGKAEGYLGTGWPAGENGFRWMVDKVSEFWFEHPGPGFDYLIDVDATPYIHGLELPRQRLSVEVRGTEIASEVLFAPSRFRWRVPSQLLDAPGPIRVSFHHPDATRPTDFGDSADDRMLALAVRSLQLIRLRPDPPNCATLQSQALPVVPRKLVSQDVVFVGNCQMEVLARLYKAACVCDDRIQVTYVASYEEATEAQLQVISQAGILVQQVLDFVPIVGDLKSGGRVVQVPHFTAAFLWPFTGQAHPQNRPEPMLDDSGPYPAELGDSFLNRMITKEVAAEDAVPEYLATDVPALKRIDRLAELFLEKQRARDRACGFSCADYIEANFRTRSLFRTPNHPEDQTARWFAAEVFGRIRDEDVGAQIAAISIPLFSPSEMPIHPLVGAHFSLSYIKPERRYQYYNEGSFTFEEWAGRYMRYEWNAELARGLHLLQMGTIEEAVRTLMRAMPTAPRAAAARVVLADALERLGRLEEAVESAYEAVAIEPQNTRYFQRLLEISDRNRRRLC